MLDILLILFGLFALAKGEFRITHSRMVRGDVSRALGVLMLASVVGALVLPSYGLFLMLGALLLTIIIGLATAKKVEAQPKEQPRDAGLGETEPNTH